MWDGRSKRRLETAEKKTSKALSWILTIGYRPPLRNSNTDIQYKFLVENKAQEITDDVQRRKDHGRRCISACVVNA